MGAARILISFSSSFCQGQDFLTRESGRFSGKRNRGGNKRRERRNSGPLVFLCWAEGAVLQRQPQKSSHVDPWWPPQSRRPGPGQPRGQPAVLSQGSMGCHTDTRSLAPLYLAAAGSVRHSSPSQGSKWRWGGMGESSGLAAGPGIPPDPCGQRLTS